MFIRPQSYEKIKEKANILECFFAPHTHFIQPGTPLDYELPCVNFCNLWQMTNDTWLKIENLSLVSLI